MKKLLMYILGVVVIASCSSPKYTYYFDNVDYNAGRPKQPSTENPATPLELSPTEVLGSGPSLISEEALILPDQEGARRVSKEELTQLVKEEVASFRQEYKEMSKEEQKLVRVQAKAAMKEFKQAKKEGALNTMRMDNDLKLAAIFGVIGLVFVLISGSVFYVLGAIMLILALVFLIMYISRQ